MMLHPTRSLLFRTTVGAIVMLAVVISAPAIRADITGFNNGVNWSANSNGTGGPTFTSTTLTLTDGGFQEARSGFYLTAQSITSFTASFTYQATQPAGIGLADGVTFLLQNQGPTALGFDGGGLGMAGISPSAAVEFNVYSLHVVGTNFETDGANSMNYISTSPVDLASGDPIAVSLTYNGSVLTEKLTDLTTSATFQTSYTTNLASVLGGTTAFVGFTGGTGGGTSVQVISDFAFSTVPEPSSVFLLAQGFVAMTAYALRRRHSVEAIARRSTRPPARAAT
jgi:hypothetical protein